MSNRWIAVLAAIALAPAVAAAQFTTFIAPPTPVKDSVHAAAVSEQRAVTDSITHARITDMTTWVDSAAGIAAPTPGDSIRAADTAVTATTVASRGIVAPATASSLPVMLLIGVGAMIVGAGLAFPRGDPARVRDR